jgi:hypothetical protein
MLAMTSLTILYLLCWTASTSVIRSFVPAHLYMFTLAVILGCILMLVSNFFSTLHVTASHCSAAIWCLTLGFSLAFASLFVRNYRIWYIAANFSNLLVPAKLTFTQMSLLVGSVLFTDTVINITWQAYAGMDVRLMTPDEHRISFNYYSCDYSGAMPFICTHVGVKGALLLSAVVLAWKLRKVSSQFNESSYISMVVYNASMIAALILPLVGANIGGHESNFLIRTYAVIFLAFSSVTVLLVPKALAIWASQPKETKERRLSVKALISVTPGQDLNGALAATAIVRGRSGSD